MTLLSLIVFCIGDLLVALKSKVFRLCDYLFDVLCRVGRVGI